MGAEELLYRVEGGVATLALNRPERRNAVNGVVLRGMMARLEEVDRDEAARVLVITGTGEKAFCAGADLTQIQGAGVIGMHDARGTLVDFVRRLRRLSKPVVARVNGAALGGGLGLALACDITVAADTATFGTPEIELGLFPMMIMPLIFQHATHRKRALEMVLTGQRLSAAEAQSLGFATRVVAAADLDRAVAEVCERLVSKSPAVLRLGREAYYRMADLPTDAAFDYLKGMLTLNTLTEDAAEGVTAFLEKRKPSWKGI